MAGKSVCLTQSAFKSHSRVSVSEAGGEIGAGPRNSRFEANDPSSVTGDGLCCVGVVGTTEEGVLPDVPSLDSTYIILQPRGLDSSRYKQMVMACQHLVSLGRVQPRGEQVQSGH